MELIEDVAIVGGGPAGAYCALELAKKGMKPVVFDHSHPREKPCGGGILPAVLLRFPFVEEFRSKGFTFGDLKIISCVDTQVITKSLDNGFNISRRLFDQGILETAIQKGARLVKEKVLDVQKKRNMWYVVTSKNILKARNLVGADGVNSIVRRKTVGRITGENLGLTFGYLTTGLRKNDATIKYLAEIPGYIWAFPGKDHANIGVGSKIIYGSMIKTRLDAFVDSHFPRVKIISKYAAMLPSANNPEFFRVPCAGKNWILIGDAAGHVDPISGGGILYALWGGKLAAHAIGRNDLRSFDKMWRNEYGRTLEERCRNKEAFFDPVKSTVSMFIGLANKSYFWPTT